MIDSHHHLWCYSKEEYLWNPEGSQLAHDNAGISLFHSVRRTL